MARAETALRDRLQTLARLAHRLDRRERVIRSLETCGRWGAWASPLPIVVGTLAALGFVPASPWLPLVGYGILVMVAGAVAALSNRAAPQRLLLAADERYENDELLSTAYEELSRGGGTRFREALGKAAAEAATAVKPKHVFPLSAGRRAGLPALVAAAAAALILLSPILVPSLPTGPGLGAELADHGSRLAARAESAGDEETAEIARRLEQLGERLQERGPDAETERMARSLRSWVEEKVGALARTRTPGGTQHSQRLAEAESLLDAYLTGRGSGGGEGGQTLAAPMPGGEESEVGAGDAGEADAGEADPGAERSGLRDTGSGDPGAGSTPEAGEGTEGTNEAEAGEGSGPMSRPGAGPGSGGDGVSPEGGGGDADGDGGREDRGQSPPSHLPSEVRDGESIRLFMRRLADLAESSMEDREIRRSYERAVEEAMNRQHVPPAAEALVRDYFVIIGISPQGSSDEPTER